MYRINVSEGKDYYSQRNNRIDPMNACQVTSLVMAASYVPRVWEAFIRSPYFSAYREYDQPEDRFHKAMLDWGMDPEVHGSLMSAFNRWVGSPLDFFSTMVSLGQVLDELQKGLPVVMSGTFPGHPARMEKPYGHVVCLVGAEWDSDGPSGLPDRWIVDDPYGNTMDNWKGSGNDVPIPHHLFNAWMKACGDADCKWAHRFRV